MEVTGRKGRKCKQLLVDLKETGGNWKLKREAPDRSVCRTRFGKVYAPVVKQTTG
jgi:hypothetical protein